MSVWTHVAGIARIDSFDVIPNETFEEKIGYVVKWESASWEWDLANTKPELFTPFGSEGGVNYSIIENKEEGSVDKYCVTFYGDLRNYDDVDAVECWFEKILYESGFMIRDAVLSIDLEFGEKRIVFYDEKKNSTT